MPSNPHVITTVKCAQCDKHKQIANHWFVVRVVKLFTCRPMDQSDADGAALDVIDRPVCGQACAQKELETYMTDTRNASNNM